ncbi:MAG: hypothetical protein WB762_27035 [Candidatus Sulfotelmatobacter sp.]
MLNRSHIRWAWFFSIWATWLVLSTLTSAEVLADAHVKVGLISEQDAIVPRREFRVGIRFDLEDTFDSPIIAFAYVRRPPAISRKL